MRLSKKALIVLGILLIAVTPAIAQLAGTWAGEGKGNCHPRPGTTIYPWQEWKGEIPNTQDVFTGKWCDESGAHGTFKAEISWPSITTAVAKGAWYWYDPLGSAFPVYGGDFEMTFYVFAKDCNGQWDTHWLSSSAVGTMKGYKVP